MTILCKQLVEYAPCYAAKHILIAAAFIVGWVSIGEMIATVVPHFKSLDSSRRNTSACRTNCGCFCSSEPIEHLFLKYPENLRYDIQEDSSTTHTEHLSICQRST